MSKTRTHAEEEFDILVRSAKENDRPIIEPFIPEILALCEKFGVNGESGGSAPYTIAAITDTIGRLLHQKNVCPLTGEDSEWSDVSLLSNQDKGTLFQNRRCSAVFKDNTGKAWFWDAIVWEDEKQMRWGGCAQLPDGRKVTARQFIKSFPFDPKTFVIGVTSIEAPKDDWTFYVSEASLEKVYEHYMAPDKKPE